jgi:hypothetical protein
MSVFEQDIMARNQQSDSLVLFIEPVAQNAYVYRANMEVEMVPDFSGS